MSRMSRAKKLSLDPIPTLEDGNDASGANSAVIEDNFQNHPLLTSLVMETLFKQYSLLKHDGSTALVALSKLRGVCKTWNREIGKTVRKQTHINVERILTKYPNGLGWKASRATKTQDNIGYKHLVPMPEDIGTFENVNVIIKKCTTLKNTSIIKWFQVMGGSVKSLRLTCPLTCYHQNRFIEKILTEWCPNMTSLTLKGTVGFEGMFQNSFFINPPALENKCGSLKELVFNRAETFSELWMNPCGKTIQLFETVNEEQRIKGLGVRYEVSKMHSDFVKDLIKYMGHAGEPDTSSDHEQKLLTTLVKRPIGLVSVNGLSPASFGPHVPEFIREQFKCDPGYETDGGVIGQLMMMSKMEKLVIHYGGGFFVEELFSMVLYRPNFWLQSLQDFKFVDNCAHFIVNERVYKLLRDTFCKLGFPVKSLKFEGGKSVSTFGRSHDITLKKILAAYADSLEDLEIKWQVNGEIEAMDSFPVLPKLKSLVVDCVEESFVCPARENFWVKFPKLEKCFLKDVFVRHSSLFGIETFGRFNHPLKVLKLANEFELEENDIERIGICFPNLKSVELFVAMHRSDFEIFWKEMGKLSLEHVKMTTSFTNMPQKAVKDNIGKFKDLKSMDLTHFGRRPLTMTSNLATTFAKAPNLQFMKFTNFKVRYNKVDEFKSKLASCIVEIPVLDQC